MDGNEAADAGATEAMGRELQGKKGYYAQPTERQAPADKYVTDQDDEWQKAREEKYKRKETQAQQNLEGKTFESPLWRQARKHMEQVREEETTWQDRVQKAKDSTRKAAAVAQEWYMTADREEREATAEHQERCKAEKEQESPERGVFEVRQLDAQETGAYEEPKGARQTKEDRKMRERKQEKAEKKKREENREAEGREKQKRTKASENAPESPQKEEKTPLNQKIGAQQPLTTRQKALARVRTEAGQEEMTKARRVRHQPAYSQCVVCSRTTDKGVIGICQYGMCDGCRYTPDGLSLLHLHTRTEMGRDITVSPPSAWKSVKTQPSGAKCRGCASNATNMRRLDETGICRACASGLSCRRCKREKNDLDEANICKQCQTDATGKAAAEEEPQGPRSTVATDRDKRTGDSPNASGRCRHCNRDNRLIDIAGSCETCLAEHICRRCGSPTPLKNLHDGTRECDWCIDKQHIAKRKASAPALLRTEDQ